MANHPLHQHFSVNNSGRDFFVGDVHGCFYFLEAAMQLVEFDPKHDRIFSTGDLVDRGEFSEQVIDWLARPYFYAVRGNHKHVLLEVVAGREDVDFHKNIMSGDWWYDEYLSKSDQKKILSLVEKMPLVISVDTIDGKTIGIVHADVWGNNWTRMLHELNAKSAFFQHIQKASLWSRYKITHNDNTQISGIDAVVVGHTPVSSIYALGNVVFIDTGMGTDANCQKATFLEAADIFKYCSLTLDPPQ